MGGYFKNYVHRICTNAGAKSPRLKINSLRLLVRYNIVTPSLYNEITQKLSSRHAVYPLLQPQTYGPEQLQVGNFAYLAGDVCVCAFYRLLWWGIQEPYFGVRSRMWWPCSLCGQWEFMGPTLWTRSKWGPPLPIYAICVLFVVWAYGLLKYFPHSGGEGLPWASL